MILDKQFEATEDESDYLRPISNLGNSTLVEEVRYSNITAENEHQYMNSKYGEIISAIKLKKRAERKINAAAKITAIELI